VTSRGSICWADLGEARGSRPDRRRPVLVIQSDPFNTSRLNTVIAAVITSNTALAAMPGNVFLPAAVSDLPGDLVVNVTALVTRHDTFGQRTCTAAIIAVHIPLLAVSPIPGTHSSPDNGSGGSAGTGRCRRGGRRA
jgi:mRNA interferase MazF